jgi:hypothetical protein
MATFVLHVQVLLRVYCHENGTLYVFQFVTINIINTNNLGWGGWEFLSSPPRPERLWGPPSHLSNGNQVLFPGGKVAGAWSWPLTSI